MPLPPPKTIAGPSTPALNALMSWLDPKPVQRNIDGVEQPACSNGRDVLRSLQLAPGVADSLAEDIDVWLSIGRIGAVPIPDTVEPATARIILQRLRAINPAPAPFRPPVIGTPVKEGLSKGKRISHREMFNGRIGRRKAKVKKSGERGGHVIGYTRSNHPIYASHHESNKKTLAHMKAGNEMNEASHAAFTAHHSYSRHDHLDAAEAHQAEAARATTHEARDGAHHMSQAHSMASMMRPVRKSFRSVGAYAGVQTTLRA